MVGDAISLKGALEAVARLSQIKKELSDADFKQSIVELRGLLLDAQENILELREENLSLKQEVEKLAKIQTAETPTVEIEGFLYDLVNGQPSGLPYCPTCLVKEDGKRYRLGKLNKEFSECNNCKVTHNASSGGRVNFESSSYR